VTPFTGRAHDTSTPLQGRASIRPADRPPGEEVRALLAEPGFGIANMSYRITRDGPCFEYRVVIRTIDPDNTSHPAASLRKLELVSTSTTATAAALATAGTISVETAGMATVLTSMTSALVDIPVVYQQTRQMPLTRRLTLLPLIIAVIGVTILILNAYVRR
jgi:hypothetical protein